MAKINELTLLTDINDSTSIPAYKTATGRFTAANVKAYVLANLLPIGINNVTNLQSELTLRESTTNKGVAGGYAPLGTDGKVPAANLPASSGSGSGITLPIAISDVTNLSSQLASKLTSSSLGVPNGIAPLGIDAKVPAANLPSFTNYVTKDYLTPIVNMTSSTSTNQANGHNKLFVYNGTTTLNVTLEAIDVGCTMRFVQANTGQLSFFATSGGQRQTLSGPYTQAAQSILSFQDVTLSAGKGAAVMAVLVTPTVWHISGALI